MKWPKLFPTRHRSAMASAGQNGPPDEWDDALYLSANPDVARAVEANGMASGWVHYQRHGQYENRPGVSLPAGFHVCAPDWDQAWTRDCADPWVYAELTPDLEVRPCCNYSALGPWEPAANSLKDIRDSAPFHSLRESLRSGRLSPTCAACHMKPKVPVETMARQFPSTDSLELTELRIDMTSRCNLRCVYCAVSQPGYQGKDIASGNFDPIIALASAQGRDFPVWLNGHGETTFHDRWTELAGRLLAVGSALHMTTNLARSFDAGELACLSRFRMIQVSLDTVDSGLLRETRRKMQLPTVVRNLREIHAHAMSQGLAGPLLTLGCVVHDLSYPGLPDLARFAAEQGFSGVTFWDLVKYPDLPGMTNVYPVRDLHREQLVEALASLEEAERILLQAGVAVQVAGSFTDQWRERIKSHHAGG